MMNLSVCTEQGAKVPYNYETTILPYTDGPEYRNELRRVFRMETPKVRTPEWDDDESWDEVNFDDASVTRALNFVMANTQDCEEFRELYERAAGFMISTDQSIGLSVLFAFDYFYDFHQLLRAYLSNERNITDRKVQPALQKMRDVLGMDELQSR